MSDTHEFDPNAPASGDGIFGIPIDPGARVRLLGVPFEATCSFGGGTRNGPELVLEASRQVDLLDADFGPIWKHGITLDPLDHGISAEIAQLDERARKSGEAETIQQLSTQRTMLVESWTRDRFADGAIPGILGGDHSCPLGAIRAAALEGNVSVLHFDAHHDLRDAYEGVRESHASILRNVLEDCAPVDHVVQVGIRDFCDEEVEYAHSEKERLTVFYAHAVARRRFRGESFATIVDEMLAPLGDRVWVTFDIDALDPALCPGTGTPVPGGLSFDEACFILTALRETGRGIVGFDLCEVAGDAWDGNVGARIIYKLCGLAAGEIPWN